MSDAPPGDTDDGPNPLEQQRELMQLLGQETRHLIIKAILGHSNHLASMDELSYMIGAKNKKTVREQALILVEEDILARYERPENQDHRGIPHQFYGPTEYGIDVLGDFNYLKGVPMNRALYEKTRKNEKIERHEGAPRPTLPGVVRKALRFEESAEEAVEVP